MAQSPWWLSASIFALLAGCEPRSTLDAAMGSDAPSIIDPGIDVPRVDSPATERDAPELDGGSGGDIGRWMDGPGTCPTGQPRVELDTSAEIEAASRGEAPYDGDAPGTCYLIRNGTYTSTSNVLFYVQVGGDTAARRIFVGESRSGVVIHQRGTLEAVSHVEIRNLTFDLTGYSHAGAFNTLTVIDSSDILVSHVDFTGDCATGLRGGHVEVETSDGVTVEDSLIERFGQCTGDGHLDHGVYLASGTNITVRNNEIRENSSRGIQLNTEGGAFGTLDGVVIERNRIHDNGNRPYEDGIVLNATDAGLIANVTIRRNLIYRNRYSGLRFSGSVLSTILVEHNTFAENGGSAGGGSPSEINLDDVGSGGSTVIRLNVIAPSVEVLNDCYDAGARGFSLEGNFLSETAGLSCSTGETVADPGFVDAAGGDFHRAAADAYGAYAP